jgi:hypothetical protein
MEGSVFVGNEHVPPLVGVTLIDEDVGAASFFDLELGRKALQTTQTWPSFASDEKPVAGTKGFTHGSRS